SLACAIRAPTGVRVDGGVARNVQHHGALPLTGRSRQGAEQRLGQSKGSQNVRRQRPLEVFTFGVPEQGQRRRPKMGSVVDQNVEASELAGDLLGNRIDIVLYRNIAGASGRAGTLPRNALRALAATG